MNAVELLLNGAGADDSPAILALDRAHTFGELRAAVRQVSSWLRRSGLERGDRVVLVGENSFFWVAGYLGTIHAGGIVVPLPSSSSSDALAHVLAVTSARFGVLEASRAQRCAELFAEDARLLFDVLPRYAVGANVVATFGQLAPCEGLDPVTVSSTDLAALMSTSGSTGAPRLVMISHANIAANTTAIAECLSLGPLDRTMVVLPLYYCYGASLLHTQLSVGGSLVFDHRFMFPDKVLARMRDTECTGFAGVPSHFQILLRRSSLRDMSFPKLRQLQQAGGKLPESFVDELVDVLAPARVFVMYGQTEATARLSILAPELLSSKRGSVGRGIPGVRLRVVDESGADVAPGERGEIVAEGASIACGYWQDEAATAATFREGRLHTGDIATIDAEGFITIVDRERDFVKCGGVRVGSRTVEDVLLAHDGVVEGVIVAVPDELLGEAIHAYVVARDATDTELVSNLHAHCSKRLSPELVPKQIFVLERLPKNDAGKVLKRMLRRETP